LNRWLLALLLLAGCALDAPPDEQLQWATYDFAVQPNTASPGIPRTVSLTGLGSDWQPGEVTVDFGPGVNVAVMQVISTFHLRIQLLLDDDAALGVRDITVSTPDGDRILRDGFVVEPGSIDLFPTRAAMGDTVEIEITGWGTDFIAEQTIVSLGPGIDVLATEVTSPSRLLATVHVPLRSDPGRYDVVVYQPGGAVYSLSGGFLVDRDSHLMTITPDDAAQRDELGVRVFADGGQFVAGQTELIMGTGVVVSNLQVLGPEWLAADLRIGNNARVGPRDVEVRVTSPGGDLVRLLPDGFNITGGAPDPLRARASLSFGVARIHQPDICTFSERVYASASFYEPNDFPCPGSGASSTMFPPPEFDVVSSGFAYNPGGASDCPPTRTFDAGPYVTLESPEQSITLLRNVHPYTGRISYQAEDLTLADYRVDTSFDLVTPGGDLGSNADLPAWDIADALHTVPTDYNHQGPDWCGYRQNLGEDFRVRWDAAQTYDVARMYLYLTGSAQGDGVPIMMVYPWDDGDYSFTPDLLSHFTDGGATLLQNAYRQTRFDVPGSDYVNAGFANSNIYHRGGFLFDPAE